MSLAGNESHGHIGVAFLEVILIIVAKPHFIFMNIISHFRYSLVAMVEMTDWKQLMIYLRHVFRILCSPHAEEIDVSMAYVQKQLAGRSTHTLKIPCTYEAIDIPAELLQ